MKGVILVVLSLAGFLFGTGCSKSELADERVEHAEVTEPVAKTSGQVQLGEVPEDGLMVRELIVVGALDEATRAHLQRQRELFELKVRGEVLTHDEWQQSEQYRQLLEQWKLLTGSYPEPLIVDVDLGNNRLRKYPSERALYDAYRSLFFALEFSNMQRGIEFIQNKINEDRARLELQLKSDSEDQSKIAEVTLQWLKQVHGYLSTYIDAANEYWKAEAAFATERAKAMALPQSWDEYVSVYETAILVGISKQIIGSTEIAEDGQFEVEGQGELLVRLEYVGPRSAYFLVQDQNESRVQVENLREFIAAPNPTSE